VLVQDENGRKDTITRKQYARAATVLWLREGRASIINNPGVFARQLARDRRRGKPYAKAYETWDMLMSVLRKKKSARR
jgi:hypothetical protein